MAAADVEAASDAEADFGRNVDSSVLPLFLSLARENGLRVCFVRVSAASRGRPAAGESDALRIYMRDFRAYVEASGGFMDDHDDPSLARSPTATATTSRPRARSTPTCSGLRLPAQPVIFHSLDFVVFFLITTLSTGACRAAARTFSCSWRATFLRLVHPWFLTSSLRPRSWTTGRRAAWTGGRRFKRLLLGVEPGGQPGPARHSSSTSTSSRRASDGLGDWSAECCSMPALRVVLPVGISFYTFQELSYTIGRVPGHASRAARLPRLRHFVCFFPQLVAGPIERAAHLLPQVEQQRALVVVGPRRRGPDSSGAFSRSWSSPTTWASSPTRSSR